MRIGVLVLWTACLAAITLSVLRFVWVATELERLLTLSLLVLAGVWALAGRRR